jgi:hypothetical protein
MNLVRPTAVAIGLLAAGSAWAGAELKIDDESSINLGFRGQVLMKSIEADLNGDDSFDNFTDFQLRRARIRLLGKINPKISMFLQTEFGDDVAGGGGDVRLIDGWVSYKFDPWAQVFAGMHMAPSSRQATTGSGGLMTMDRPGNNTKNLSWGTRALRNFSTATVPATASGLIGQARDSVRDTGATLFGSGSLSDTTHLKYYVGLYDGVQVLRNGDRNLRMTTRAQVNFGDAEAGYFNTSTYLGKKKTLALGVSYDTQDQVQGDITGYGDYTYFSVDAFLEQPMGDGTLTLEAAFSDLDLDGFNDNALRSEGDGYYVQAGYYMNKWQPWVAYEAWDSNATDSEGTYDAFRVGISYFFKGHNANVKAGFEQFNTDIPFSGSEDSSTAFILGFFITY